MWNLISLWISLPYTFGSLIKRAIVQAATDNIKPLPTLLVTWVPWAQVLNFTHPSSNRMTLQFESFCVLSLNLFASVLLWCLEFYVSSVFPSSFLRFCCHVACQVPLEHVLVQAIITCDQFNVTVHCRIHSLIYRHACLYMSQLVSVGENFEYNNKW